MSCCPTSGSPSVEVEQLATKQRVEKATARLSIEAMATPTLRQRTANAIAAAQIASTMFAMAAMLRRHTAQLKMPRPDAYGSGADEANGLAAVDVHHNLQAAGMGSTDQHGRVSSCECSGSGIVIDIGSAKAVAASANATPCFETLDAALIGSHWNSSAVRQSCVGRSVHIEPILPIGNARTQMLGAAEQLDDPGGLPMSGQRRHAQHGRQYELGIFMFGVFLEQFFEQRASQVETVSRPSPACLHLQPPRMQQRLGIPTRLHQPLEHQIARGLERG